MSSTCKYCHCDGLVWVNSDGHWRLTYPSGQMHRCIGTRSAIAKHIAKPVEARLVGCRTQEEQWLIGWTKEALKLKPQPKSEDAPPEAAENYSHPWWDFLDGGDPRRKHRPEAARQQVFEELVP